MSDYQQVVSACPIVHHSSSAFREADWGRIDRPTTRLGSAALVERVLVDYSDSAKRAIRAIESVREVHGDMVRVQVRWQPAGPAASFPLMEGWVPRAALRTIGSGQPLEVELCESGSNLLDIQESRYDDVLPVVAVRSSTSSLVIPARLVRGDFGMLSPVLVAGVNGPLS